MKFIKNKILTMLKGRDRFNILLYFILTVIMPIVSFCLCAYFDYKKWYFAKIVSIFFMLITFFGATILTAIFANLNLCKYINPILDSFKKLSIILISIIFFNLIGIFGLMGLAIIAFQEEAFALLMLLALLSLLFIFPLNFLILYILASLRLFIKWLIKKYKTKKQQKNEMKKQYLPALNKSWIDIK